MKTQRASYGAGVRFTRKQQMDFSFQVLGSNAAQRGLMRRCTMLMDQNHMQSNKAYLSHFPGLVELAHLVLLFTQFRHALPYGVYTWA
jgi:hypothetical protein